MNIHFDAIIVTAIPEEWYAVGEIFGLDPEDAITNVKDPYFAYHIGDGDGDRDEWDTKLIGRNLNVGIFCAVRPGNHSMAATTANLIGKYSPSLMVLAGIAAGKKDGNAMLGDVITPGMILDYSTTEAKDSSGWMTESDEVLNSSDADIGDNNEKPQNTCEQVSRDDVLSNLKYALRNVSHNTPDICLVINGLVSDEIRRSNLIRMVPSSNELKSVKIVVGTELLTKDSNKDVGIDSNKQDYTIEHTDIPEDRIEQLQPKLLDGVLASANILSRASSLLKMLSGFNAQLRGLEMESAGFATACNKAKIPWIVGKSICDWGDESKSDGAHKYAALTSAVWAKSFIRIAARKGFIFSRAEDTPPKQKRDSVISLLTYLGKAVEYQNPRLKMNIQIYSQSRKRDPRFHLTREIGLLYCGEPGIRSGRTQSKNTIDVIEDTSSDTVEMCICVAAREERNKPARRRKNQIKNVVKSRSGTNYKDGFYFDKVQYKSNHYSTPLRGKVSPRQKWVIAYPLSINGHSFVVSHSGSNDIFKLVEVVDDEEKEISNDRELSPEDFESLRAVDVNDVIPILKEEWNVIQNKLKELLVAVKY